MLSLPWPPIDRWSRRYIGAMRITGIDTCWLRVPLPCPIRDSTHVLRVIDLILVTVRAGDYSGTSYMLSFDNAPALLKGFIDWELKRHLVGQPVDDVGVIR